MTENKRFILADIGFVYDNEKLIGMKDIVEVMNILHEENEQLQNQIDELEDDNEKYSKSLDKLEDYTKRFIPTKCLNEFKDCKTNRYYWLDHEGNLEGALELLNLMDCENEQLKQQLAHHTRMHEWFRNEVYLLQNKLDNREDELNELNDENQVLRETLKNQYINEICETCKFGQYDVNWYGEGEFECLKGHNAVECDGKTECEDFELDLKKLGDWE